MRTLFIALLLSTTLHASVSIITGQIKDAQGNPINGSLVMRLPIPAQDPTTQSAIANVPVTFQLINGNVTGGAPLYDLATIQPGKLWYSARAYDTTGALVFYGNYYVTGATFNIGAATPTVVTTSNISFAQIPTGGGAGGFGSIVPNPFTTISSAIAAGGPVIVLPTSTDNTTYTNPSNVRIENYKQKEGVDSGFFRDVSEWGKIDGITIPLCTLSATSTAVTCTISGGFTGFVNSSVASGGDVGKLIMFAQAGAITGQVFPNISVVSGGTGGTPGQQGVIFNDPGDGCNTFDTMPYYYATVNSSGVPTGTLTYSGSFPGKGCTRPPTSGTVNTVTGTVTFSGGVMKNGDLVTTITAVNSPTQITIGTPAVASISTVALYGSDVHNTFQTACNAINSDANLKGGTLTFSGIGLTSTGIDCVSPGLHIIGNGFEPVNSFGAGSTLVYAGSSAATGQYVLNLAGGWGETIEGIGIRGNTTAKPYAIKLTYNNATPGNFGNPAGKVERTWLGWEWGDQYDSQYPQAPRLQSCIFSDGQLGNDDFWSFDRIYCFGADTGVDSFWNQAVNYHWGKVQMEYDNVGFAFVGNPTIEDYFTEFNRVDIMSGSPYWPNGAPIGATFRQYGGESSAKAFEPSPLGATGFNAFRLEVDDSFGLGAAIPLLSPDGISADFSTFNSGTIKWNGPLPGKVRMNTTACSSAGTSNGYNIQFTGVPTTQMVFVGGNTSGCRNLAQGGRWLFDNPNSGIAPTHFNSPTNQNYLVPGQHIPLMLDTLTSQINIGSLFMQAATSPGTSDVPGSFTNTAKFGTTGATTYNYRVSCVDPIGKETDAFTFPVITSGNATLSTNNYNIIFFWPHQGCESYNLYGDQGSGSLGLMTPNPVTVENMGNYPGAGFNNLAFFDQGQYTKNTGVPPPTFNNSGSLTVPGPAVMSGKLNIADKGQCTMAAGTCSAQNLVASYTNFPLCYATWTGVGTLTGIIKISSTTGTASTAATVTPSSSVGTDTAIVNWMCLGN